MRLVCGSGVSMLHTDRLAENLRSVFVDQYYDKVGEVFPERKTNTHNNNDGNTKDAVRETASFSDLMLVLYGAAPRHNARFCDESNQFRLTHCKDD